MPSLLLAPGHAALPAIKGSRFLGDARRADDEPAARAVLKAIRAQHHKARHHCFAWRLADGTCRRSDDGEPSGTGGPPILALLEGRDLLGVIVVVTRYYGGVKLGTGGLARAYSAAAAAALDAADIALIVPITPLRFAVPYRLLEPVQWVLAQHNLTARVDYGAQVSLSLDVPDAVRPALLAALESQAGLHSLK